MDAAERTAISPTPDDEEAAAMIAALTAYLAERQRAAMPPARVLSPWALAGRLANQGFAARRIPGSHTTWANAPRRRP